VSVKGRIDLTTINELGQIFQWTDLPLLEVRRIDDTLPVLIGKPGGTDKNVHFRLPLSVKLDAAKKGSHARVEDLEDQLGNKQIRQK
jgi:hypothetical protein